MTVARTRLTSGLLGVALGLPAPAWGAIAPPSPAGAKQHVGVLPLHVEIDGKPAEGEELGSLFTAGLSRSEVKWATVGRADCDNACVEKVAKAEGITHIVRVRLTGASRDYELAAEILDASGAVVATTGGTCDTCGASELEDFVGEHAVRVAEKLAAFRTRPPVLLLESTPPGAIVRVDGEVVGKTPLEYTTVAGKKHVRLELPDHVAVERKLELVDGVNETVRVTLEPRPETSPGKGRTGAILGGVSLGAGLGVVAGGIAYLVIDGDPVDRRCNGINVDGDGDCKYLHDTRTLGIGLTAAGAALAGVGVGLLVWSLAGKRRDGRDRAARLRITPGGVQLSGRF